MTAEIQLYECTNCGRNVTLVTGDNFPLYYFGAGPNNPEDATSYFCGAACVTKHQMKEKT